MKKERQSGIDLLKVLAMVGVIILHYNNGSIGRAFALVPPHSMKACVLYGLESMFICAVNVFMMISGYFMIGSKRIHAAKPIFLLIQVSVFQVFSYLLQIVFGGAALSAVGIVTHLVPASYFAVLYAAVYLLSPFVNKLLLSLKRRELNVLMALLSVLLSLWPYGVDVLERVSGYTFAGLSTIGMYGSQSGYTLIHFLFMYAIGAYIAIAQVRCRRWVSGAVLCLCWAGLFVLSNLLVDLELGAGLAWEYCNPLVILSAAAALLLCKDLQVPHGRMLGSLSKATFAVYLLNPVLILLFVDTQTAVWGSGVGMLANIALSCAGICLFGWGMQLLYDRLTQPVVHLVQKKWDMTLEMDR